MVRAQDSDKGKSHRQKELEMISGSPLSLQPSILEESRESAFSDSHGISRHTHRHSRRHRGHRGSWAASTVGKWLEMCSFSVQFFSFNYVTFPDKRALAFTLHSLV